MNISNYIERLKSFELNDSQRVILVNMIYEIAANSNSKKDNFSIVEHGTTDTTFALTPNEYHKWGEVTTLDLILAIPTDNTIVNEYMFQFTSGIQATTLSLPQEIKWIGSNSIEASKTYQVSIINGIGVLGGV